MNDTIIESARRTAVGTETSGTAASRAVASSSAVSWGAILAGAAAAAALSLILLVLGVGLGLSSVSPWSGEGASAKALSVSAIVWLILMQLIAAAVGGYLAGRLRTRWLNTHVDEVYFRDTAHGFIAWAIATLATAATLTTAIGGVLSTGAQAGAAMAGGATVAGAAATPGLAATLTPAGNPWGIGRGNDQTASSTSYFVDRLFRQSPGAAAPGAQAGSGEDARATSSEVGAIFARGLSSGTLPPEDAKYLAGLVAQRTGLSEGDAEKRVNDTFSRLQASVRDARTAAQQAANNARKASAYTALWFFVSLLAGAFIAAVAATYGGRRRDQF